MSYYQILGWYEGHDIPATDLVEVSGPDTGIYFGDILVSPGIWEYNGKYYALDRDGLLLITSYGTASYNAKYHDAGYRIVWDSIAALTGARILALLGWISQLVSHGASSDEYGSTAGRRTLIKGRRISVRCTPAADLALDILQSVGVTCRRVHLLTGDVPTNVDDGHVAVEWLDPDASAWRLFDVDNHGHFGPISLDDFVSGGSVASRVLLSDPAPDYTRKGTSNAGVYYMLRTGPSFSAWAERIYQIPGVLDNDGRIYYHVPTEHSARTNWVLSLSSNYRVLPRADWLARFY